MASALCLLAFLWWSPALASTWSERAPVWCIGNVGQGRWCLGVPRYFVMISFFSRQNSAELVWKRKRLRSPWKHRRFEPKWNPTYSSAIPKTSIEAILERCRWWNASMEGSPLSIFLSWLAIPLHPWCVSLNDADIILGGKMIFQPWLLNSLLDSLSNNTKAPASNPANTTPMTRSANQSMEPSRPLCK